MPSRVVLLVAVPLTLVAVSSGIAVGLSSPAGAESKHGTAGVVATQATPQVSTRTLFRSVLPRVRRRSGVPILLPSQVPAYVPASQLSASGSGFRRGYSLALASDPRCGGATACFVGSFTGERGGRPAYRRTVRLVGGTRGYYKPLTCGASCSPPAVQWVRRGVLYEISYAGASRTAERGVLVGLAGSAIRTGSR